MVGDSRGYAKMIFLFLFVTIIYHQIYLPKYIMIFDYFVHVFTCDSGKIHRFSTAKIVSYSLFNIN